MLVVRELRSMANESKKAIKIAPRAADEQLKWLQWPEYVMVRLSLQVASPCGSAPASMCLSCT